MLAAARVRSVLALLLAGLISTVAHTEPPAQPEPPLPEGAVARLGTTQARTTATALALAADGRTLLTLAGGRTLGRWDSETGHLRDEIRLKELAEQGFWFERCWFSADRKTLAVPDRSGIGLWDTSTGQKKRSLAVDDQSKMTHAAFSPDGRTLATLEYVNKDGNGKGYVRLWPTDSGKERLIAELPSYGNAIAFSPDGRRLFAAVDNHSLRSWDTATGRQLWQNDHWASHIAVSPDGKTLCTDTYQQGPPCLWNPESGEKLAALDSERCWTGQILFTPDGRTLAQATDKGVLLWDVGTRKLRRRLESGWSRIAFASDGKSLFTLGPLLERWDLETGKSLYPDTRALGHVGAVQGVLWTADGRSILTCGADKTVRLWDRAGGKHRVLRTDTALVLPLDQDPGARFVLAQGEGGAFAVIEAETGREVRRFQMPQAIDCLTVPAAARITPDSRTLLALGTTTKPPTGSYDPFEQPEPLRAWDVATGKETLAQTIRCGLLGCGAAFSPNGRYVVRASYPELHPVRSGTVRPLIDAPKNACRPVVFSPDGRLLAIPEPAEDGFAAKGTRIHEVLTGRPVTRMEAALGYCKAPAFSPAGQLLAASGLDALWVWEATTGRLLLRLPVEGRLANWTGQRFAECLAFAPNGRTLATGHGDGTVLLWDLKAAWEKRSTPKKLADRAACWVDLAALDARKAIEAVESLTADPPTSLPLLREHLRPVKIEARWLAERLADLDHESFDKRETATEDLKRVVEILESELEQERKKTTSEEVRRRLAEVLATERLAVPAPEAMRSLRAVAILERIGSGEAKVLLQTLADGSPGAELTVEAKAALARLAKRTLP
jgi:WD40 repeat protein